MTTVTSYSAGVPPPPTYNQGQAQYGPTKYGQPQTNVVVIQQPGNARVHGTGGFCPYCGLGHPRENITILGVLIALIFFPIGIICCLMMTERRCTHCRANL